MKRIANRDVRHYVSRLEIFKANNIFSEQYKGFYTVFSYGHHFPMYAFDGKSWYENVDKYSVTTSKHHTQARPRNVNSVFTCCTVQLQKIIAGGTYA